MHSHAALLALRAQLLEQIEVADLDSDVVKAFMRTPAVEVSHPQRHTRCS